MSSNDPCVLVCELLCLCGLKLCSEILRRNRGYTPISYSYSQDNTQVLQFALEASMQSIPDEILYLNDDLRMSFAMLYVFADVFGRMPKRREEFAEIALGKWLFEVIYVNHRAGKLTLELLLALYKVPHYPIPIHFDRPQGLSELTYHCAILYAAENVPNEISNLDSVRSARDTFVMLYVFALVNKRMPEPGEQFGDKALGNWVQDLHGWHRSNKLSQDQLVALSKVPHYSLPIQWEQPQSPSITEQPRRQDAPMDTEDVPVEISSLSIHHARKTFVLLYVFANEHGRMPGPGEKFGGKALGNWVQKLYDWHRGGRLPPEQLMALSQIPHYPIPFDVEPPAITQQPTLPSAPMEEDYYASDDRTPLLRGDDPAASYAAVTADTKM